MKTETTNRDRDREPGLRLALWSVVLVGLALALLAGIFAGGAAMLSVGVGAAVAALNLWSITLVVRGQFGKLSPNVPWGVVGMLKFILLFAGVYGLIRSGLVQVLPLLIGYGALPLGIVAAQISPSQAIRQGR